MLVRLSLNFVKNIEWNENSKKAEKCTADKHFDQVTYVLLY